jgi:hypothetical protein
MARRVYFMEARKQKMRQEGDRHKISPKAHSQ